MSGTVCAVVVTHNRKALLRKCLTSLLAQTRPPNEVLVVDNASTDGTPEMIVQEFASVQVVQLGENLGGSGGFHAGMKWAHDRGFHWIWITDEDAVFCATGLERLLVEADKKDRAREAPCALWSNVITEDPGDTVPPPEPEGLSTSSVKETVEHAMFVGLAVPRWTIDRVGLPRRDFFIYCDDVEFCLRIRRYGGEILRVPDSFVYHKDWQANMLRQRFCGVTLSYPDIPGWKVYYLLRNNIQTKRRLGPGPMLRSIASALRFLAKSVILKPQHCYFATKGIIHGLLDISGIKVRPE